MNTHRLVILVVALNLMMFIGSAIYNGTTTVDLTSITNEEANIEQHSLYFRDDFGDELPDPENQLSSSSFGDERGGGLHIFKILADGIRPIPIRPNAPAIERYIARGFTFFKYLLTLILGFQIYFVIKNKKQE